MFLYNRIAKLQGVVSRRFIMAVVGLFVIVGLLSLPGKGQELAAAPGDTRAPVGRDALEATSGTTATNVIVMIGDGMGPEQVEAARYYSGGQLSFEILPYQAEMTTYSASSSVTDSAAAATAMATGVKVNNGVISLAIPGDSSELPTALEEYKAAGKMVGLVTTAYVTHATPAGWGAHETSRNNYSQIATDLMTQTKPHVLLGGASYVTESGAQAAGYTVVDDRASMQAVNTDTPGLMLSGQFGGGGYMPYEYGGEDDYTGIGALPHLREMTVTALDVLDNDPDGFFLMVEGARIDHAGHSNLIYENIFETIEFGNAVQEVLDWVDEPSNGSNWSNTLVIVTADHETGGLIVTGDNGEGELPDYDWTSTGHTGVNVPVYAKGDDAEQVTGVVDNTDIYNISTVAPAQTSFTFAAIGDFGGDTATEGYVADMIAGWNPDFVVTTGDNYYNNAGGSGTGKYDEAIGKYYCSFLEGITTSGTNCPNGTAATNAFFPSLGNHDYSDAGGSYEAGNYIDYFDLPGIAGNSSGSEYYYDFVQGPVHFFAINSNTQEDDGYTSTSVQATWLQAQLAASTAPWKVVYFHHAPYSTAGAHGDTSYMQWPFNTWGVDVVLNGHDHTYERLEKDGVWYFVTGNSGWNLRTGDCYTDPTAATSHFCYDAHYGAMRITATDSQLYLEELIIDDGANGANGGRVIDTFTLPETGSSNALIDKGDTWNYLDNGSDQGSAWQAISFNDSGWSSGSAQLGYGDGDETTVVSYGSDANNKYITTYFRNTFTVADASAVSSLAMQILRDDGALVYLNGNEVYRSNMPTGTVNYLTTASSAIGSADESAFNPATIDAGLLVDGANVIAVEIHQSSGTSSDISFDFELVGTGGGGGIPPGTGEGTVLREWWTGISGTAISGLTSDADYPDNPDGSDFPTSFEAPTNWADNYGTRMRGYLHAPVTGQYTFWIASDDNGELYLSSDASPDNAALIANVPGWSSSQQWDKYAEQQSNQVSLQAGELYYLEALMKEGGGGDNLAVAWLVPGGSQEVIPGEYLTPYVPSGAVTVDFQEGVAPSGSYDGTRDTYISQNSPGSNYGNSGELLLDGDDPSGTDDDLSTLLKWDTSSIPAGSLVQDVTITLDVFNSSPNTYELYEMKQEWVEGEASWNEYDNGLAWATAGALAGADRGSIVLGTITPSSTGSYVITLNADGRALAQTWINNSSSNYGVIIADSGSTDGVDMRSSEYGTASSRPKLSVTYIPGGPVDVTPPVISLLGANPVELNVGDSYSEAGATAVDDIDGDISDYIVIDTSEVNTTAPGSYQVTYNVSDAAGNAATEVVRTVNVSDVTAPVITLLGANPLNLNVGDTYNEPGAIAVDEIDGDISVNIVIDAGAVNTNAPGSYAVTYNVSDAAGNAATQVVRTVNVADVTAPVITLLGENPLALDVGDTYVEPEATAVDNVDGVITANIVIDASAVNTAVPGSYAVTYDVSDAAGNAATQVIRTVNVVLVDVTPPVIFLLGDAPLNLNVGDSYNEPGATATDNVDGDISGDIVIDASAVNTSEPGSYAVTYNVSDAAGNAATEVVRTVNVSDATAPVITLLGVNPLELEVGDTYNDSGATAIDNVDGDISDDIVIDASAVNTAVPGSYAVTYNVSDAAGNAANEIERTVNVVDATAPVITLVGASSLDLDVGDAYIELGATAVDNVDGDLSAFILIDAGAVSTAAPGSYNVTYNVSDAAGNAATQVIRTVNVHDVLAPVITLQGADPQIVNAGTAYLELGATAVDDIDGDISGNIVIDASAVNTAVPGSYVVTYNVSDAAGNVASQVSRTVNVVDVIAPVITLVGASPMNLDVGEPYIELGATAIDDIDDDISGDVLISGAVDTAVPGSYAVTYNVSDAAGNAATPVVRTVNVYDVVAPVITVLGANPLDLNVGDIYIELGATAVDDVDDDVSGDIVISGVVNTAVPGSYAVTYNVSDAAGNAATPVVRTINVHDVVAPVITLQGANPQTVNAGAAYLELGATAVDDVDGDISGNIVIDASVVNSAVPGSYIVTYDVSDVAGNAAVQVERTVNVVDATAPVITLMGSNPLSLNVGDTYTDPGATAFDSIDGDISNIIVVDASAVDTSQAGSYSVTYNVTDAAGNQADEVVRIVNVVYVDITPPVITLLGDNPMTLIVGEPYSELGATAQDDFDGDISGDIVIDATAVNTLQPGFYNVTYNVSDAAGNAASEVVRTVDVVDVNAPVITLLGDNPLTLNVGDTYTDPGATAEDDIDGDISINIVINATAVNTSQPGSYNVTYNVSDAAGNAANEVVRTVSVIDETPPVITLLGDNPLSLNEGDPYVEPGATALDDLDGDISINIVIDDSAVNTSQPGSYNVTYNVSDAAGNAAAEVVRTVEVVVVPTGPNVQVGTVTGVGSSGWTKVNLSSSYSSMVVVATANYGAGDAPAAIRIRNAAGSSFEVLAESVNGSDTIIDVTVYYTVVEEGVYTVAADGVKMEAVKYLSTVTDRNGSWVGESRAYNNAYTNPVVVGQVMTYNDADWSEFWAYGSSIGNPPSSSAFYAGKMVAEDSDLDRVDEIIGYIVVESGQGSVSGLDYVAGVGADTLAGFGDSPPYTYGFSALESAHTAVVSQNGMDGNNGGWAVLYGANPLSAGTLALAIDEDQIRDSERNHTTEQAAYIVFGTAIQMSEDLHLQYGVVSGVNNSTWTTVSLGHSYTSMIVVAAPNYDASSPPLVVRLRNTAGSNFEVRVDRADGSTTPISGIDVHYMVVEEGVYSAAQNGIKMEAGKYLSTVTDDNNSWVGEYRAAVNNYTNPVVLGQVMTYADAGISTFWARGSSRSSPPSAGNIYMGKSVAEDPDNTRNDEMIGYIIIEAASGSIDGVEYMAALGADTVEGMTNNPPDTYTLSGMSSASTAVISAAGMDGGNGGWPVLYGASPITTSGLQLTFDEDQLQDSERGHITEQVAYIIFE